MPEYRTPNFVHSQDYSSIPKSIDDLFTAYLGGKMKAQQFQANQQNLDIQRQQADLGQANFMAQNQGLTPGQFANPQNSEQDFRVHDIMSRMATAQQLAAQQQVAGLQKTQEETRGLKVKNDMMGGDVVNNVLEAVRTRKMSPNQADDYLGRNPDAHISYINALAKSGLDVRALQNEYDKSKATAQFEGGQNVQEPVRLVQSINEGLPKLNEMANSAGVGNYPAINSIKLAVKKAFGSVAPQEYQTQLGEIRAQIAQVLQAHGAPAESAVHRAEDMIPNNIGKDQLNQVVNKTLPELLTGRAGALAGNKPNSPVPGSGGVVQKTLKDGSTVNVKPNGKGGWVEVR